MGANEIAILATLVVYKLTLIGVGVWAARLNASETDFFLGGRKLGAWVAGLSYAASTSSAWVLLGVSGFIYAEGVSAIWMVPGVLGGYVVMWAGFGRRLREESAAENQVTLTDFLAARATGGARTAIVFGSAALILVCFIFYIAAQFGAAALAFESRFAMGHAEAVFVGAGVILLYSLLGGFWAVSVTDALQGFLMALISVALPAAALIAAGGPGQVIATLSATAPEGYLAWDGGEPFFLFLGFALGIAGIGLGTMGQPQLFSRIMGLKDEAARRKGFAVAMIWGVLVYAGMITLALSGRALMGGDVPGESLLYDVADSLLPAVLAGVVIAAVLSAVMSTVDSLLIATSAAVAHDMGVARRFRGREVLISRAVMTALCVLAVFMALALPSTIFDRVLFSWSALGAAFGPTVLARVMRREPAPGAILLSMALGFGLSAGFFLLRVNGAEGMLGDLAALPGSPMERVFPWIPALITVFVWRRRA